MTWDTASQIQIELKSLPTFDEAPVIYLDSIYLTIGYGEAQPPETLPTIILKDPSLSVVSGKPDFVSGDNPTFDVTDPNLSVSDIKQLVKDGKAEVTADPDGVLSPDTAAQTVQQPGSDFLAPLKKIIDGSLGTSATDIPSQSNPPSDATAVPDTLVPVNIVPDKAPPSSDSQKNDATSGNPSPNNNVQSRVKNANFLAKASSGLFFNPFAPNIALASGGGSHITDAGVYDSADQKTDINAVVVTHVVNGVEKEQVKIEKPARQFRPGKYTLKVTLETANAAIVSEQDFTWGVLAINTDKSVYLPGNDAYLQMGVLSDTGDTICGADLYMVIKTPSGVSSVFSTANNSIVRDSTCGQNNLIYVPDYYAHYSVPTEIGVYEMDLTATTDNGVRTIIDHFNVATSVPFTVVRQGPTRINPAFSYPVSLSVTPSADWQGTITEEVPASFDITQPAHSRQYDTISTLGDTKTISWNVSLSAGVQMILGYHFQAPVISPQFYLLGPATFTDTNSVESFKEYRQWQIASDAACASPNSGTSNWNTIGTWNCGHVPTTGDTVTITAGGTVTMDVASAVLGTITVNGTLNTSNGTSWALSGTTLTIGSAGTLTANGSTITLSATTGTLFTLTSGGTFTSNTSTVDFTGATTSAKTATSGAFTGSNAFNNLTINPAPAGVAVVYTFNDNSVTMNGNFSITCGDALGGSSLEVDLGASTVTVASGFSTGLTAGSSTKGAVTFNTSTSNYAFTTGALVLNTNTTFTPNSSLVTFNATSHTLFSNSGTLTAVGLTSEWDVTSTSGPVLFLNAAITLHKLTINTGSSSTIVNAGALITIDDNSGAKLYVRTGVLNDSGFGYATTASTQNTLQIDASGTLCLGGAAGSNTSATCDTSATSTTTRAMPTFHTYTLDSASTVIYLSDATTTVTTIAAPGYGNLTFRPVLVATPRVYTLGNSLLVAGSLDSNPQTGAVSLTTNLGNGGLTVTGSITLEGTTSTSLMNTTLSNFALTAGSITIKSGETLTSNSSLVTLTGTSGTLFTIQGTFSAVGATSEWDVTSASGTPTLLSAAATFHILKINAGGGAVINAGANITTDNAPGNKFYVLAGIFNLENRTITLGGTGVMEVTSTICLGGTTGATNVTCDSGATQTTTSSLPTTVAFDIGSTAIYLANAAQTISSQTYHNLSITPKMTLGVGNLTYTMPSSVSTTINGNFNIKPKASNASLGLTVNLTGATTVAATATTTIQPDSTNSPTAKLDTVASLNTLSTGLLDIESSGTLTMTGPTAGLILTGTSGTLFTNNGTFTQGSSTVTVTSASGAPTLLSGTGTTTFHILTINSAATVVNEGGNLSIDNAIGNKFYIQSGVFNTEGNIISASLSTALQIDSGGTLCLGGTTSATNATCDSGATQTSAIAMPAFNSFTLDAASTVIYLSDAATTVSRTPIYGNLTLKPKITSARTYTLSGAMTINGNFDIKPGTAANLLTVNMGGDITVASGGTTTIERTTSATSTLVTRPSSTDYNLSTGNLAISAGGTLDCTGSLSSITVTGNWTNSGTFTAGSSTVILNTGTTATVTGTTTFYNFSISHSAAKEVDFATASTPIFHVTNNFTVTGHAGARIKLYSDSAGTKWQFHPTGTATVDYADVKDGGCQAGAINIIPIHFLNSGNNDSCWIFSSLTFNISANAIDFGTLSSSAARYANSSGGSSTEVESHNFTVNTNAPGGYAVTVQGASLSNGPHTITAIGGSNTASSPGTEQYGIRLTATGGSGTVTSPYSASGFAYAADATTASQVCSETAGDSVTTTYSVRALVNISSTTNSGSYTGTLTYVVSGTF